ncbi:response regulator transcription factor [Cyanobium sp. Morenito 9A2]|uniref:response regulator transcription factor n=1 Tax=Cyanobium sp. Morenito 9A2 TaxID=2823718 RepID=UPI0020CBC7D7|nr:response regulator transcription factor [Cyanobium sp. Morenito 9A2]MCP9848794.1 response regulator transcription factor [Cyanobium sp. Morenito 9A2]
MIDATEPKAQVLVVDDDPRLRALLCGELGVEGYGVSEAVDGQSALIHLRAAPTDLILLDWTLPDFSGVEICRRMRSSGVFTPILMLTGRDEVRDRVEALDSGADDFLLKPFSIEELLARVRAQLRRAGYAQAAANRDRLELADLSVILSTRDVSRGGRPIQLSVREYDLLVCLLRRCNSVVDRESILREVWGENHFGDDNLLDVYIRYLRKKIEASGQPTLIQTVRGVGFMLREGETRS